VIPNLLYLAHQIAIPEDCQDQEYRIDRVFPSIYSQSQSNSDGKRIAGRLLLFFVMNKLFFIRLMDILIITIRDCPIIIFLVKISPLFAREGARGEFLRQT